jgi:hypothetical protein
MTGLRSHGGGAGSPTVRLRRRCGILALLAGIAHRRVALRLGRGRCLPAPSRRAAGSRRRAAARRGAEGHDRRLPLEVEAIRGAHPVRGVHGSRGGAEAHRRRARLQAGPGRLPGLASKPEWPSPCGGAIRRDSTTMRRAAAASGRLPGLRGSGRSPSAAIACSGRRRVPVRWAPGAVVPPGARCSGAAFRRSVPARAHADTPPRTSAALRRSRSTPPPARPRPRPRPRCGRRGRGSRRPAGP